MAHHEIMNFIESSKCDWVHFKQGIAKAVETEGILQFPDYRPQGSVKKLSCYIN